MLSGPKSPTSSSWSSPRSNSVENRLPFCLVIVIIPIIHTYIHTLMSPPNHSQVTLSLPSGHPYSTYGHPQSTFGSPSVYPGQPLVTLSLPRSPPGHPVSSQVTLGSPPGHPQSTLGSPPGHHHLPPKLFTSTIYE